MQYLDDYIQHLTFERGLSPLTCKNYRRDIELLATLLENSDLATLNNQQVRRYIGIMHSQGLSSASIARALSAWRGLFEYLIEHRGFTQNPITGLRAPKAAKPLPQALSVDQAVKLVELEGDDLLAIRDRAILELFYSSGLRLAELVNLDTGMLDFADGTVTVTGKGSKTRIVPLGSQAATALQHWLAQRSSINIQPQHQHAVFITRQGHRITPRAVQYRVKSWAIKQGINTDMHPHLLRHSFASHVLQSSQDLRAVQEMLGHANISTTQVYTHLDFQHLSKIYDSAHPRARKK